MSSQDKAMDALLEMGNLSGRRTRAGVIEHALRTSLALTDADAAVLMIPSRRRGERLVMHAGSEATALLPIPKAGSEALRILATEREPLLVTDMMDETRWADDACPGVEAGPVLFTGLQQRDPEPGYLAIYRRRGRARFNGTEVRGMVMLSAWLGLSLESLRRASGIEKRSVMDGLTEIYNAGFMKIALRRELRRAGRFGQELSVILVAPDPVLALAEAAGDDRDRVILKELATLLAQQVRSWDLLARHGDRGFLLMLPQTSGDGAADVAERIRAAVEQHAFSFAAAGAVTVSAGVSSFPKEGADDRSLIASVERAQARARERGPNQIEAPHRRAA